MEAMNANAATERKENVIALINSPIPDFSKREFLVALHNFTAEQAARMVPDSS